MKHRTPHVEVLADYDAIFASNGSRQPEHHLMRAVLAHAIRTAQDEARGSRARSARHEAIAWGREPGPIPPVQLREHLRDARHQREVAAG